MKFKLLFPSGYSIQDYEIGNIDINIVFDNGDVFFGTAFTIDSIKSIMSRNNDTWFWATNMFIISDLDLITIRNSIEKMISENLFSDCFHFIGNNEEVNILTLKFDQIEDKSY